ncbi:MAG: methionine synthase, partial [Dongiaceae bacterium]
HLRSIRAALEAHEAAPPPTLDEIVARLGQISNGARALGGGLPDPLLADSNNRRRSRRRRGTDADDAAF